MMMMLVMVNELEAEILKKFCNWSKLSKPKDHNNKHNFLSNDKFIASQSLSIELMLFWSCHERDPDVGQATSFAACYSSRRLVWIFKTRKSGSLKCSPKLIVFLHLLILQDSVLSLHLFLLFNLGLNLNAISNANLADIQTQHDF